MPILEYLFENALAEHPSSKELQILHITFLRFVFSSESQNCYNKMVKMQSEALSFDLRYTAYAGMLEQDVLCFHVEVCLV